MKTLYLPLKKEWYNKIEAGEKMEDYRELKPYWMRRLLNCNRQDKRFQKCLFSTQMDNCNKCIKQYDKVRFSYGYTKRTMMFSITEIVIGYGREDWGANNKKTFIIKLKQWNKSI